MEPQVVVHRELLFAERIYAALKSTAPIRYLAKAQIAKPNQIIVYGVDLKYVDPSFGQFIIPPYRFLWSRPICAVNTPFRVGITADPLLAENGAKLIDTVDALCQLLINEDLKFLPWQEVPADVTERIHYSAWLNQVETQISSLAGK